MSPDSDEQVDPPPLEAQNYETYRYPPSRMTMILLGSIAPMGLLFVGLILDWIPESLETVIIIGTIVIVSIFSIVLTFVLRGEKVTIPMQEFLIGTFRCRPTYYFYAELFWCGIALLMIYEMEAPLWAWTITLSCLFGMIFWQWRQVKSFQTFPDGTIILKSPNDEIRLKIADCQKVRLLNTIRGRNTTSSPKKIIFTRQSRNWHLPVGRLYSDHHRLSVPAVMITGWVANHCRYSGMTITDLDRSWLKRDGWEAMRKQTEKMP